MKLLHKLTLLGSVLTFVHLASAIIQPSIVGDIHIVADGSITKVDSVSNTVSFTNLVGPTNARVAIGFGDYGSLYGVGVNYMDFAYDPFSTQTIWSIDADTYFVLERITSIVEGAGILLTGWGTAFHDNFAPTGGSWSFSTDTSNGTSFAFSSTTSVPDGGSSMLLIGFALSALCLASRRLKNADL